MATQKQIDANRRNAQKSTGPRGPRKPVRKPRTSLCAKRDAISGQVLTLSEENRPVFENLKAEMIAGLAPKTVMELSLANSIAWDTWRLNHLRAVEMNMYALGTDTDNPDLTIHCDNPQIHTAMAAAVTFSAESHNFALMSIYEQRLNRSLHKNLETLRQLQTERKANHEKDRAEEILLARYSEIKGLPYSAPAAPTANGSVFSNREIFAAANRLTTLAVAGSEVYRVPLKVQYAGAGSGTPSGAMYSTPLTNLSTMPSSGAKPAFLSR